MSSIDQQKAFIRRLLQTCMATALLTPSLAIADLENVREIVIRSAFGTGSNIVQLREVVAIDSVDNSDVATAALGASVSVKETYEPESDWSKDFAIDGIAELTNGGNAPNYHSERTADQWLKVTLPANKTLKRIELLGRADCCSNRDIYDMTLLNETGDVIYQGFHLSANNADKKVVIDFEGEDASHIAGQWEDVLEWPLVAVSMANLPDGRILTYSGSERRTWPTTEQTYSATWDPIDGTFSETLHTGHNMFCGTMSMLDDGRVFVAGGRNQSNSPWTSAYNYETDSWLQLENLASGGRWYPTTLALGNGDVLSAMGIATNVRNPDIWSPTNGTRVLNGIDFIDMRQRRNENGRESVFPILSLMPSGSVYHFWDTTENHYIDTSGNGSSRTAQDDTDSNDHAGGTFTMYDEGKLLITGNNDGSWGGNRSAVTNKAFTVDLNGEEPVIRSTNDMNFTRKYHQLVTLPTGEVLTIGGNESGAKFRDDQSVHTAEIWNPETGVWRSVAAMSIPRDYHSTALLMFDGRVITAGGGYDPGNADSGGTHQDAQIYSPPYLFNADGTKATRPTVASLLDEVNYGDTFSAVTTGDIAYFSLIKLSSTTHAVNTDVRQFRPDFSAASNNRYNIVMHDNENVATPGYWMLFAVDTNGVPSVADIIRVDSDVVNEPNTDPSDVSPIVSSPAETGEAVQFSISATGSNLTYSWNFGDGSGDSVLTTENTISHTFSAAGRYLVNVTVTTATGQETVTGFYQIVHDPLPAEKAKVASALLEIADSNELWNTNPDNDSVAVIDTSTKTKVDIISVGNNPRSLAQAPDGRIWVVNKDDASISIIDRTSRSVVDTIELDRASRPHSIVFNSHSAYITLEASKTVLQLNASDGTERSRLGVGHAPRHLTISANGEDVYVTDFVTPAIPGESGLSPDRNNANANVYKLTTSISFLASSDTIKLKYIDREVSEHSGPGVPNYLGPVLLSPYEDFAWVPSKQDNIEAGERRGGAGVTFDQTVRAITSKINLSTGDEILQSRVDHDNSSIASHGAYGPFGQILFVSLEGNRQIAIIDTSTDLEFARFDAGHAPQSMLLSESGKTLYVHNFLDRTVSIVDVADIVERGSSDTNSVTDIKTVDNEALSAQVLRGKQLFYDARDDRLAALDYMACAACHNDGENDGRTWDFSGLGEGLRNTNNLRGNGKTTGALHWSGNFDEVQDFETPIRVFAGGAGLMDDEDFLTGSRSNPFGLPKAGISEDLDALAAYVESLDEALPSPFRNADGSLTSAAQRGRSQFAQQGCSVCHAGDKFTDSASGILHDIGTLTPDSGERSGGALTGIDTPTLLGAWKSGPYLHDGGARTLAAAIQLHNNVNLNSSQLNDIAAFVQQIDSSEPAVSNNPVEPPDTDPPAQITAHSTFARIKLDDNSIDEWPVEASIGVDPQDATGGPNKLDFERAWIAHDDRRLYIRYDNHTPNDAQMVWGNSISIDVGGDANGFNNSYLPGGVDFLIEGNSIYRYTGTGDNWSWAWVAEVPMHINGRSIELAVERTLLGNPETFNVFFYADNSAIGGTAADFLPDAAPDASAAESTRFLIYDFTDIATIDPEAPTDNLNQLTVVHNPISALELNGDISDWSIYQSFADDAKDVTEPDSTIDYLKSWGAHDDTHFYFALENDGPISLSWGNAMYLDTDINYATGFRGFLNDSPIGMDYLIEADLLYRYTGNGSSWSWEFVSSLEVWVAGNSMELRIPIEQLDGAETIDLFFYGDNTAANSTGSDFYPDGANNALLDNSKRHFRYTRNASLATETPESIVVGEAQ